MMESQDDTTDVRQIMRTLETDAKEVSATFVCFAAVSLLFYFLTYFSLELYIL